MGGADRQTRQGGARGEGGRAEQREQFEDFGKFQPPRAAKTAPATVSTSRQPTAAASNPTGARPPQATSHAGEAGVIHRVNRSRAELPNTASGSSRSARGVNTRPAKPASQRKIAQKSNSKIVASGVQAFRDNSAIATKSKGVSNVATINSPLLVAGSFQR